MRLQVRRILSFGWLLILVSGALLVHWGWFENLNQVDVREIYHSSSLRHPLGTDSLGRDFLIRLFQGSGTSLLIATQSIVFSLFIALIYGGSAGWMGRRIDTLLMALLDVWMSIPASILAAMAGLLVMQHSSSLALVSAVIGLTHWGRLARLVRSEVYHLREQNFIQVTHAMGGSGLHIFTWHLWPHLSRVVGIFVVYQIPSLILAESFLSFIGLGVQSPETSWGILLQEGWRSLQVYPHVVFYPALFLFLTVASIHTILIESDSYTLNRKKRISPSLT